VMNPPNEVEREPTRTGRAAIGSAFLLAEPNQRADSDSLKIFVGTVILASRSKVPFRCRIVMSLGNVRAARGCSSEGVLFRGRADLFPESDGPGHLPGPTFRSVGQSQ